MLRQKNMWMKNKSRWFDFLCVLPALAFFVLFTYYPIIELFRISLTDWNLSRATYQYVGLKNYQWLFMGRGANAFYSSLSITLLYTLGEVVLTLMLGLGAALLFNRDSKLFSVMRVSSVMPRYIVISSTALVFMWLYNDRYGVFNYLLKAVGLEGVNWLGNKSTALISLILYSCWRMTGYTMLIYLSAMKGISPQYLEAASIDGANGWQQLLHIKLPLLAPTTLFLTVTTVVSSMKVFQAVDVLTQGGPYKSTMVLVFHIYNTAFTDHRLDRAAAIGCIFFLLLLGTTALTMKWSQKNVSYDA